MVFFFVGPTREDPASYLPFALQVLSLSDVNPRQARPRILLPHVFISINLPIPAAGMEMPLVVLDASLRTANGGPVEWPMVLKSYGHCQWAPMCYMVGQGVTGQCAQCT